LSPETLVPRPDTETVVETALTVIDRGLGRQSPVSILDLGTGSGAILLALLSELPQATGVGVDLAEGAARTARRNAERSGLADRARFVTGCWAGAIGSRFDLVVANPPYVESATIDRLALEVRDHDPHLALDGGPDGLDGYRAIVDDLDCVIGPQGAAFLEIGAFQADPVRTLGEARRWTVTFACDLAGIRRVAVFERRQIP
jgi:release factor glutamine methyltransferase